jgi:hypothetical protein
MVLSPSTVALIKKMQVNEVRRKMINPFTPSVPKSRRLFKVLTQRDLEPKINRGLRPRAFAKGINSTVKHLQVS